MPTLFTLAKIKKTEITAFDDLTGGETYQIISSKLDAKIAQLQDVDWRRTEELKKLVGGISLHASLLV